MTSKLVPTKNALEAMAARLKVNPDSFKETLKQTICKGSKQRDGKFKPLTDAEFIAFAVVANTYKLNPFTKEIYAYPDTKSGGIIPIVSTDGWNKLMTTHKDYKRHFYTYSEEMVTPDGGKECPTWIEIHIEKQDGSIVPIREYLDECYRKLSYPSPWQTHTKRMLRHKTKIQGAREAFGFGGIYDKDEAERIIEAETVKTKPETAIPERIVDQTEKTPTDPNKVMLEEFEMSKSIIGDKKYYNILKKHGYAHSKDIKKVEDGKKILTEMKASA